MVDSAKVAARLREGATLVLQGLDTFHPGVAEICREIERMFRAPVFANAFLTPASATGFAAHYDPYDAFLVQITGEKLCGGCGRHPFSIRYPANPRARSQISSARRRQLTCHTLNIGFVPARHCGSPAAGCMRAGRWTACRFT